MIISYRGISCATGASMDVQCVDYDVEGLRAPSRFCDSVKHP